MKRFAVVIASLALALAACGGSDDGGEPPGGPVTLQAEAVEFSFSPDAWFANAAETITVEFTNAGSIDHTWIVLSQRVESEDEITDAIKLFSMTVSAGETLSAKIPSLDAGTYQVVCDIDGHFSAGMEGELRISG